MSALRWNRRLTHGWVLTGVLALLGALPVAATADEMAVESTTKELGPEPNWNCGAAGNAYEFCETVIGCRLGAYHEGAEALDKVWGTGYTIEPVDDDEWFPMEWTVKHPNGVLSASGTTYECYVDQTKKNQSEVTIPPYMHCTTIYQNADNVIWQVWVVNPYMPCMGWFECVCN